MNNYYLIGDNVWELYIVKLEPCKKQYKWKLIATSNTRIKQNYKLPFIFKVNSSIHDNLLLKSKKIHSIRKFLKEHFEDFI